VVALPDTGHVLDLNEEIDESAARRDSFFAEYVPNPRQAERDARDAPSWWASVGVRDETVPSSQAAAVEVDPSRAFRGFAGGVLCAQTPEEYVARLATQEVAVRRRLRDVLTRREELEVKVKTLTSELESETQKWVPYLHPPSIKRLVQESTDALDAPLRREWERAFEKKVLARKQEKDQREIDRKKKLGIFSEEDERRRIEAEAVRRAEDIANGVPVADELAEFRVLRKGEEFKSLGFLAIVAPDGSLLEWAGDGAQFLLSSWRARYRVKPWVVDSALLQFIASKKDSSVASEADLATALMAEGSTAIIRAYKLGGEKLPLSGLELAKQSLMSKRAMDQAAAALTEASRLGATRAILQRLQDERKAQRDEKRRIDDEKKRAAEIAANEDLSDKLRNIANVARSKYFEAQKYLAEFQLRQNAELQLAVAAVRRDNKAALGILEGIAEFRITYGVFNDADFASEQRRNFEERKPYFLKFPFNIAGVTGEKDQDLLRDPAYLWYRRTDDITAMITDVKWAPYQGDNDLTKRLLAAKYSYVTEGTLFPQTALWYTCGSGRPITSMTITFDLSRIKLMENKGFRQIEGACVSDLLNPNAKFWYRAGRTRRVKTEADVDVVTRTETLAIELKIAQMNAKVELARESRKKGQGPTADQVQQIEALQQARNAYALKRSEEAAAKEGKLAAAAIEFMGIAQKDVDELQEAYNEMDADLSGAVDLNEFFAYIKRDRTPIAESIFYFLDASFNDQISFGTFLRTVCTFCMFGAKDVVTWIFSVVAANTVGKAESLHAQPPLPGRAGAKGQDQRNKSVYWKDAVAWSGLKTSDTQGKISTEAFRQLLYNIHPPTSTMVTTVKRAIARADKLCVGGQMRLFQFRQVSSEFPTLLSPIFLMQMDMRAKFLGEDWWAEKRELFESARGIVQGQMALETREKMRLRDEERKRAEAERDKEAKRKKAGGAAAAAAAKPSVPWLF
jgi:hypothetical protein